MTAQAVETAPNPSQDPIIQHLKLSNDQVDKIKTLHSQMEKNLQQISTSDLKKGVLADAVRADKWDEKAVNAQLKAISDVETQARYYRVKYYFDMNKVLTPEQREIIRNDLVQAASR
ncbi:TPA: Spy/CpxP family protein refolding chaperone [Providencia alcalifaciens]|nr:Spy/CpxP family protein refolding chaperone [Providencia alcalifaciens]